MPPASRPIHNYFSTLTGANRPDSRYVPRQIRLAWNGLTTPFFVPFYQDKHPYLAAATRAAFAAPIVAPVAIGTTNLVNAWPDAMRNLAASAGSNVRQQEAIRDRAGSVGNLAGLAVDVATGDDPVARAHRDAVIEHLPQQIRFNAHTFPQHYPGWSRLSKLTGFASLGGLARNTAASLLASPVSPNPAQAINNALQQRLPEMIQDPEAVLRSPLLRRYRDTFGNDVPGAAGAAIRGEMDDTIRTALSVPAMRDVARRNTGNIADVVAPVVPGRASLTSVEQVTRPYELIDAWNAAVSAGDAAAAAKIRDDPRWAIDAAQRGTREAVAAQEAAVRQRAVSNIASDATRQLDPRPSLVGAWDYIRNTLGTPREMLAAAAKYNASRIGTTAAGRAAAMSVPTAAMLGAALSGLRGGDPWRGGFRGATTGLGAAGGLGLASYMAAKSPDAASPAQLGRLAVGAGLGGLGAYLASGPIASVVGLDEKYEEDDKR